MVKVTWKVPSFVVQTDLLPGESLPSFMLRLKQLNLYEPSSIMTQVCREGLGYQDSLDSPRRSETYARLAALTKTDAVDLYAATAHRFADVLTPRWVGTRCHEFIKITLPGAKLVSLIARGISSAHHYSMRSVQYCPVCVEEAQYHRLAWMPHAVAACLKHSVLLQARCPGCLSGVGVEDVINGYCQWCEAALRSAPAISIKKDRFGLFSQQLIQSWLAIRPGPTSLQEYSLPSENPAVLFQSVYGLVCCMMHVTGPWKYFHRLPGRPPIVLPTSRHDKESFRDDSEDESRDSEPPFSPELYYCLYATAVKALVNWPLGLHEFLEAYRLRNDNDIQLRLRIDLGGLYDDYFDRKWQNTAFQFLQDAFEQYVRSRYVLSPATMGPGEWRTYEDSGGRQRFISIAECARILGTRTQVVQRLLDAGGLTRCGLPGLDPENGQYIRRGQLEDLILEWKGGIAVSEAASWLGTSNEIIEMMVDRGLLARSKSTSSQPCPELVSWPALAQSNPLSQVLGDSDARIDYEKMWSWLIK